MPSTAHALNVAALATALVLCGVEAAAAAPTQVFTSSSRCGTLSAPFTDGFGRSASALPAPYTTVDYFVSDYGFTVASEVSFSSAVVTWTSVASCSSPTSR